MRYPLPALINNRELPKGRIRDAGAGGSNLLTTSRIVKTLLSRESDEFAVLGLPWSNREFPFLVALLNSVRRVPGEIAFALGGSFASQSNVPLSDLDFFLYVAHQDAYMQAQFLRNSLASHPSVVTASPPQHYHSFGYRCAWTLCGQPVALVELFVSSKLDLKHTVMAKMNHLLIDKSRAYRAHLAASRLLADDFCDETLELILHDLIACAQKTRKAINSRSFLQAANRFYKFRMASLPILICECTGILYHPLVGEKHTQNLNAGVRGAVQRSYRLDSIEDVALHFKNITDLVQPAIRAMCQRGQLNQGRATLITEQLCRYALPD